MKKFATALVGVLRDRDDDHGGCSDRRRRSVSLRLARGMNARCSADVRLRDAARARDDRYARNCYAVAPLRRQQGHRGRRTRRRRFGRADRRGRAGRPRGRRGRRRRGPPDSQEPLALLTRMRADPERRAF